MTFDSSNRKNGINSDIIKNILLKRLVDKSLPGRRCDNEKIALIIEGGTMRGVVSAGMVAGLEELGMLNCFDEIYGASAGAITGAYFTAGQARYGTTIFYENINNNRFINTWRLFAGRPIVSLHYLLHQVCKIDKALNFSSFLNSAVPLNILATELSTLTIRKFSSFNSLDDLLDALNASARIPLFAGTAVSYKGSEYLDACLRESIPFRTAISDGFTNLVILLTRTAIDSQSDPLPVERILTLPYLSLKYGKKLVFAILRE